MMFGLVTFLIALAVTVAGVAVLDYIEAKYQERNNSEE